MTESALVPAPIAEPRVLASSGSPKYNREVCTAVQVLFVLANFSLNRPVVLTLQQLQRLDLVAKKGRRSQMCSGVLFAPCAARPFSESSRCTYQATTRQLVEVVQPESREIRLLRLLIATLLPPLTLYL